MTTEQDGWVTVYASAPIGLRKLAAGPRCWCGSPMSAHVGDGPAVVHDPGVAPPSVSSWGLR